MAATKYKATRTILSAALIIVVIDQLTKLFFSKYSFWIFDYSTNHGAAFGILQGYRFLFIIASVIAIGVIIYLGKTVKKYYALPLGLLLGGIIGNLIDRIFLGYVRDFIGVGFWPTFNIADAANTIAALLIIYYLIKRG